MPSIWHHSMDVSTKLVVSLDTSIRVCRLLPEVDYSNFHGFPVAGTFLGTKPWNSLGIIV